MTDSATMWDVFAQRKRERQPVTKQEETKKGCEHSNWIFDYQIGIKVCSNCGLVGKKNIIDNTPEWRNLKGNNQYSSDPCRVGVVNPLLPQSSLSTRIATKYGKSNNLAKMNKWQAMPYAERSMYDVFTMLDEKCKHKGINKATLNSAKQFFLIVYKLNTNLMEKGVKREGLRGGKRQGLIGACLYYACKQNNCPKSQSQISKILQIKKSDVTRGCNIFMELIKNDKKSAKIINVNTGGEHYIKEYGTVLGLDFEIIKYAVAFYRLIEKKGLFGGNTPPSLAAGSLYIILQSLNTKVTETYISKKCQVSKVTILNVNKHLDNYKNSLLIEVFVKDYCKKLHIYNKLTKWKVKKLAKKLILLRELQPCHPKLLAFACIYIILYFSQNLEEFKEKIEQVVHWKEQDLIQILKVLVFYKDDIKYTLFEKKFIPSGVEDQIELDKLVRKKSIMNIDHQTYNLARNIIQHQKKRKISESDPEKIIIQKGNYKKIKIEF